MSCGVLSPLSQVDEAELLDDEEGGAEDSPIARRGRAVERRQRLSTQRLLEAAGVPQWQFTDAMSAEQVRLLYAQVRKI